MNMNFLINLLMAQEAQQGGGSIFGILFPLILLFVLFYFLIILPQSRQEKKRKAMIAALKKGDRVLTAGGIIGTITRVNEDTVSLKVAPNVVIKVEKNSIKGVLKAPSEEAKE